MAETTIFSGEVLLMPDPSDPSWSNCESLDFILESGKQYRLSVSGYHSVTASTINDSGEIIFGPVNIGESSISIHTYDNISAVYVETNLMIGDKYVDAPTKLVMQIDQVVPDQTSNAGVMRVIKTYNSDTHTYILDSTWQEIADAFRAGCIVYIYEDVSGSDDTNLSMQIVGSVTGSQSDGYTISLTSVGLYGDGVYVSQTADGYPEQASGGK